MQVIMRLWDVERGVFWDFTIIITFKNWFMRINLYLTAE